MKKIVLYIEDFGTNGEGIGKHEGLVVFVPDTVPGDIALVSLQKIKNGCGIGSLISIQKYSNHREKPVCKSFGVCGGCCFLHTDYKTELDFKRKKVNNAIKRIGGIDFEIKEITAMDMPYYYRNKAVYHASVKNSPLIGFYGKKTNEAVSAKDCVLVPHSFDNIITAISEYMSEFGVQPFNSNTGNGNVKSVIIRKSALNGGILVCILTALNKLPHKEQLISKITESIRSVSQEQPVPYISGIALNVSRSKHKETLSDEFEYLLGSKFITDSVGGLNFKISVSSFFQVNTAMASKLYEKVLELISPTKDGLLIDAYCGTGTMAILAAARVREVIGIDRSYSSINDAKENADENSIKNIRFIQGDTGLVFEQLYKSSIHPDSIILDPPRCGCDKRAIVSASKLSPKRIVYVSCDGATLARDLKLITELGYAVTNGFCFDMFGKCANVESVVLITRVQDK